MNNNDKQKLIDEYWMQYALELATKAESMNEIPVGAVLIDEDQKIIGEGWNQSINQHNPTAHAEILAMINAGQSCQNYRLINSTLYVTLEPCLMCTGAIIHARIKRVVFGASDYKTGAMGSFTDIFALNHINHYPTVTKGILHNESSHMLSAFFKRRRIENKQNKQNKQLIDS